MSSVRVTCSCGESFDLTLTVSDHYLPDTEGLVMTPELTPRMKDVLVGLINGKGPKQIASELGITHKTAKNHSRRLLQTLGCYTAAQAVAMAYRLNLVPGELTRAPEEYYIQT